MNIEQAVKLLISNPEYLFQISDEDLDALSLRITTHFQLKDIAFQQAIFDGSLLNG